MSKRNPKGRYINGVLLLDKASGYSSNSVLQDVKRLFDANKAGHTGSLDPLASGLLPICLGQATKVAQFLLNGDKRYFVRGKLGQISDTGDSDGQVVNFGSTKGVNEQAIKNVLLDFAGSINQVPPMYSALKRNGTPLYKLARKGIEVEREARPVKIHEIKFKGFEEEILSLEVSCSKGTYIRTLIEDIGESLGCGGHVIELRRIGFTHFDIPQARTFEELVELKNKGLSELDSTLLCADEMLPNLKGLYLDAEQTLDIKHGRKVQFSGLDVGQKIKLYDEKKQFIGIGENNALSEVWPKRVFV
ncbi:tRNA pseudouridine(55) synthase TruB [Candidatus Thioglobus sp.]|nr:tRNA pseudouridine(55) synthase TruB [Candidatus Thioglobus sp.]